MLADTGEKVNIKNHFTGNLKDSLSLFTSHSHFVVSHKKRKTSVIIPEMKAKKQPLISHLIQQIKSIFCKK